jgi:hypothetical protein
VRKFLAGKSTIQCPRSEDGDNCAMQLRRRVQTPSTDAPKKSSWYRIRVTRSAQFAELL